MSQILNEYKKLMEIYSSLDGKGLIGIGLDYIQVGPEEFKKIIPKGTNIEVTHVDSERIDLRATVEGLNFLTLI